MKAREYQLLERCVEDGIARGFDRAHKHDDSPGEESIQESIKCEVMNEVCEWFDFDDASHPSDLAMDVEESFRSIRKSTQEFVSLMEEWKARIDDKFGG